MNFQRVAIASITLFGLALSSWIIAAETTTTLESARKLMNENNFRDAYLQFQQLIERKELTDVQAAAAMRSMEQCRANLGNLSAVDSDLKIAVDAYPNSPAVLTQAADTLESTVAFGSVADGRFIRGYDRGYAGRGGYAGSRVQVQEQDRIRVLQWRLRALESLNQNNTAPETVDADKGRLYLRLANSILRGRSDRQAWLLQSLTDLTPEPKYTNLDAPSFTPARYAPVSDEGKAIFYGTPEEWESAKSDGERYRFALEMASKSKSHRSEAKREWANFLESQFSVATLDGNSWLFKQANDDVEFETGIRALHTLEDNETIAKLANGIQRFKLKDGHNFIAILKELVNDVESNKVIAIEASRRLSEVFLNRRQYNRAEEQLRDHLKRFGDDAQGSIQRQIDDIVDPRILIEHISEQAAGTKAKIEIVARNAGYLKCEANRVNLELLITEIRKYYSNFEASQQNGFADIKDQSVPQLSYLGELFSRSGRSKFLIPESIAWTETITPADNHYDSRHTITSPLEEDGLYLVDLIASTDHAGDKTHTARCLVWVRNAAIVQVTTDQASLYTFVESGSGKPIPEANIEFFGIKYEYQRRNQRVQTQRLVERTNADGQCKIHLQNDFQWLTIARGQKGEWAFLDFNQSWNQPFQHQVYTNVKSYGVSDRPVYRPGDTIKTKFWCGQAVYGDAPAVRLSNVPMKITLLDNQGNEVGKADVTTDQFGGCEPEFKLPETCDLGMYRFDIQADSVGGIATSLNVRVEEFRKPEFEVEVDGPTKPVALGATIDAKVRAKFYFGAPVSGATAHVRVTRETYTDNYYPITPFDWCYSPGYWWFADDFSYFPNWQSWRGCWTPHPFWFPRTRFEPAEEVLDMEVTLDAKGEAVIPIDTSIAKAVYGDVDHKYSIHVDVRDSSRRTQSASGEVIAAREPFKVYTWLDRGFVHTDERFDVHFHARQLSGVDVEANGTIDLFKISYDPAGQPTESLVESREVSTDASGRLTANFQVSKNGQYRVRLTLKAPDGNSVEGAYIFTAIGDSTNPNSMPADARYTGLELIPDKKFYEPGETAKLLLSSDHSGATVWLFRYVEGGVYPMPERITLDEKSALIEVPIRAEHQPNIFVEAFTIADGKLHKAVREIAVPPAERVLNVSVTTDKTEYLPQEEASIDLKVTDRDGKPVAGSCTLVAYDRALEQIARDILPPDIREYFWKWQRHHHPGVLSSTDYKGMQVYLENQVPWNYLGRFGAELVEESESFARDSGMGGMSMRSMQRGGAMPMAAMAEGMAMDAPMAAMAMSKSADVSGATPPTDSPKVRTDFADTALFLANVICDEKGNATTKIKMPENLTSWSIRSWSVASGLQVGSANTRVVTSKPLLVRLQLPRFVIEGDEVVLSTVVNNDSESDQSVRVSLEVEGQTQLEVMDGVQLEQTVQVSAGSQQRVDWRCRALAAGMVKITTTAIGTGLSDAMQLPLEIATYGSKTTESFAGTVRKGSTEGSVTLHIPQERRVDDSRIVFQASPSLAGAMIDALPYLAEYPYGCTEQTLNRFLPSVITQRVLAKLNVDLEKLSNEKRNNLNAQEIGDPSKRREQWQRFDRDAVYDKKQVAQMVKAGVDRLSDMQLGDGGWGWFTGTMERSEPHMTATVVRGLIIAEANGVAILPDVLQRGLDWLESYQAQQLVELKNASEKVSPYKLHPDNVDALVFHVLVESGRITAEMQQILFDQREHLSVYGKTLLAIATLKADQGEQTNALRRNIEQFLVEDTENETAFLRDSSSWWFWYGSEIEANAMYLKLLSKLEPNGTTAPRLVKYLLNNRKHSTYWNSTRDTALVVEAFADYIHATGELSQSVKVQAFIGSKLIGSIDFTPDNLFSVKNTIELSGNAIPTGDHQLRIVTNGSSNLYWNAYSTSFSQEKEIPPQGLELKIARRYYLVTPQDQTIQLPGKNANVIDANREAYERQLLENGQTVASGSMIECELLIQSKNDYEYLLIEDKKPACFEAIEAQSGYFYSAGMLIYREFREQHVGLCVRQMPKGNYSIRYQFRTEAPGIFTAPPATIEGMYAPELVGNSANARVHVED